jgi:DNA modification methylase
LKLTNNKKIFFLKLRANIKLLGDINLAQRELENIFNEVNVIQDSELIENLIGLPKFLSESNSIVSGPLGFIVSDPNISIYELVFRLNFIQEIWFNESDLDTKDSSLLNNSWIQKITPNGKSFYCLLPFMACGELLSKVKKIEWPSDDIKEILFYLTNIPSRISVSTHTNSSTQHLHSIHKYKAKFFPRMIRSVLTDQIPHMPRSDSGKLVLLDPFVGSGTSLIESALLGIDSIGVDIDKLSCLISEAKIAALNSDIDLIESSSRKLLSSSSQNTSNGFSFQFPSKIAIKFKKLDKESEMISYQSQISKWIKSINDLEFEEAHSLLKICFSDALSRKFNIRMMGTGVGRFAFEIAKTSLDTLMKSNVLNLIHNIKVSQALINSYKINVAHSLVLNGDATNLNLDNNSISVILTSPPYLPASSGREDYLIGKSISSFALQLMDETELELADQSSVGSMNSRHDYTDPLPDEVFNLYDWLLQDPLRKIKAQPILNYYLSLTKALKESFRVLLPNGIAVYVIGKESVFYRFKTREILYRVECDMIFEKIVTSCGFVIKDRFDVQLDKKNKNARPRSLDSYYESVFILRKPSC